MPRYRTYVRDNLGAAECSDGYAQSLYEAIPSRVARRLAEATRGFLIVGLLVLPASSVQAIECRAELPAHRNGHWSYRIIDGRKCWYQGKAMISKSLLHWRASDIAPNKTADAEAVTALPSLPRTDLDLISCCSSPLDVAENFEARWQGIFGTQCCQGHCSIQFPYPSGAAVQHLALSNDELAELPPPRPDFGGQRWWLCLMH